MKPGPFQPITFEPDCRFDPAIKKITSAFNFEGSYVHGFGARYSQIDSRGLWQDAGVGTCEAARNGVGQAGRLRYFTMQAAQRAERVGNSISA